MQTVSPQIAFVVATEDPPQVNEADAHVKVLNKMYQKQKNYL